MSIETKGDEGEIHNALHDLPFELPGGVPHARLTVDTLNASYGEQKHDVATPMAPVNTPPSSLRSQASIRALLGSPEDSPDQNVRRIGPPSSLLNQSISRGRLRLNNVSDILFIVLF